MTAGLLGVLRAGCAYVPLDPQAPAARLQAIVEDSGIGVIVSCAALRDVAIATFAETLTIIEVPEVVPADEGAGALLPVAADSLAYILFTSGSTGKPKGVMQTHRNVLQHIRTYSNALRIGTHDRLTLFSGYGFDAAVMDIFGALLNGACLYPVDIRNYAHPGELLDRLSTAVATDPQDTREGVTILHATPTLFRFLMRHKVCRHDLSTVRLVVLGGEEALASDFALFRRHFAPPALFVNGLGPSECTLAMQFFADHATRLPGQIVPVGLPVAATEIDIVSEDGKTAGICGELVIRSAYVSAGYWNQPELTQERFIPVADTGQVIYRTGDRVRRLPDGRLAYLGRMDSQIKVRGHRVEPGEIEAQLAALEGIDRCTVDLRSDSFDSRQAEARLVAYIVKSSSDEQPAPDRAELRRHLKAVLPDYMVPQAFVYLDEMPLLANGKVDRRALPPPDWGRDESRDFVAPRTATERQLASIWADILGVTQVSVHDDFFELGGHSLMAAQFVARVTDSLQVGLPLRRLFDAPTIASLAEHVDTLQWALQNQALSRDS
jgi:amino acid adenylation domain-containing protein